MCMGLFCYIELKVGAPMDFGMQSFAIGALIPAKCIMGFSSTIVFGSILTLFARTGNRFICVYEYIIDVYLSGSTQRR